jgi:hypothetical protein
VSGSIHGIGCKQQNIELQSHFKSQFEQTINEKERQIKHMQLDIQQQLASKDQHISALQCMVDTMKLNLETTYKQELESKDRQLIALQTSSQASLTESRANFEKESKLKDQQYNALLQVCEDLNI